MNYIKYDFRLNQDIAFFILTVLYSVLIDWLTHSMAPSPWKS
jgi:hypothetical protein